MRSAVNTAFYDDFRYYYKRAYGAYPSIDVYRVNIYSGNVAFFDGQVRQVRQKMRAWGDQNKALIITESCAREESPQNNATQLPKVLDYITTSASVDTALGQPSDAYKMVQKFGWFSLNSDRIYPECSLFNPAQHSLPAPPPIRSELTLAGRAFVDWMSAHAPAPSPTLPAVATATAGPTKTLTPTRTPVPTTPITVPSTLPLVCQSLTVFGPLPTLDPLPPNPVLGQQVELTCRSTVVAHHFDFRILFANGSTADIGFALAQNQVSSLNSYTLTHSGCYNFQCRACATLVSSSCTPWDEL